MNAQKQLKKDTVNAIKQSRKHFESEKSELLSLCKLMVLYFNYINENKTQPEYSKQEEFQVVELLITQFCEQNGLVTKAIKEIHFLCLQLEKMMKEDIIKTENEEAPCFNETIFKLPNEEQEVVL